MYPVIHIMIPSYMFFACVGGTLSILLLCFRIDKYNITFFDFIKILFVCTLFGFVGSRFVFVLSRLSWLICNFTIKNILQTILMGGFVFYGGLLGVLLGIKIYAPLKGYDCKVVYDCAAPAIPLFHAFGRVGCFMSGCCYGKEFEHTIFGITFSRIPVQLIEASFELILFVVLYILQKKDTKCNYLRIYLIIYSTFRFVAEFFRGDIVRGVLFGVSTSQVISVCIFACSIYSIVKEKFFTHKNIRC